ncbi:MAG: S1 RNA-binding domain-containing protein, partial [Desulfofustis sp.]|nr:S1 RNA-binding domain-containing protein [Desulfofustis sp.]
MTDEFNQENQAGSEELSFAELFEMEENNTVVEVGNVAHGVIIGEDDECYLVDVGDKAESYIPKSEFRHDDVGELKVGDAVEVFVERRKDEGGLLLSREKAIAIKVWEDIAKIQEADGTIQGRIDSRVKGGMSVDIGVPAFLPYSQIDLRPVKDLDALIGQSFDFKILKFNRKRNNVVISRRAILEEERNKLREEM